MTKKPKAALVAHCGCNVYYTVCPEAGTTAKTTRLFILKFCSKLDFISIYLGDFDFDFMQVEFAVSAVARNIKIPPLQTMFNDTVAGSL